MSWLATLSYTDTTTESNFDFQSRYFITNN